MMVCILVVMGAQYGSVVGKWRDVVPLRVAP